MFFLHARAGLVHDTHIARRQSDSCSTHLSIQLTRFQDGLVHAHAVLAHDTQIARRTAIGELDGEHPEQQPVLLRKLARRVEEASTPRARLLAASSTADVIALCCLGERYAALQTASYLLARGVIARNHV